MFRIIKIEFNSRNQTMTPSQLDDLREMVEETKFQELNYAKAYCFNNTFRASFITSADEKTYMYVTNPNIGYMFINVTDKTINRIVDMDYGDAKYALQLIQSSAGHIADVIRNF